MNYSENINAADLVVSRPGSPPGMSSSKSSKASSLHSFNSDQDDDVTSGGGHFEEIGLEDDAITPNSSHFASPHAKSKSNPYMATFTSDIRATSTRRAGPPVSPHTQDPAPVRRPRDVISLAKARSMAPSLSAQFRDVSTQSLTLNVTHQPRSINRTLSARSASSVSTSRRHRSPSPSVSPRALSPRENIAPRPALSRSHSWQSNRERKVSNSDDGKDFNEDDDDDNIPEGLILDNVPLSPRPASERSTSRSASTSTSPERPPKESKEPKERVRSVGNGTPPVAADRGSLKSPSWKSENSGESHLASPLSPVKGRAKSWTAAISALSPEAKALTEKLEEHADELEKRGLTQASNPRSVPKPRVKSALAELPPLRRSNIMIDPLPISKEKEAVLSRTRPSWLPPKDPAEEKKHLKEYQRMMAISMEAEKKREAARRDKELSDAKAANDLLQIWEDVLKRWDVALQEERIRGVWWKGISPKCRGAAWSRAIGNDLGLTPSSFHAALSRASEAENRAKRGNAAADDEQKMAWFSEIRADVEERTWPELKIFQTGGPLHQNVIDVLRAYAMYRSDIGYVTGCHTMAALLLLNLDTTASAFIALANILNRSLPLSFLSGDEGAQSSVYQLVNHTLAAKSPRLCKHLIEDAVDDPKFNFGMRLKEIFTPMFTTHLSIDDCTRLWDVYVFEGDDVLIQAVIALLLERELSLLNAQSESELRQVLEDYSKFSRQGQDDAFIRHVRDMGN
ncbi:hypothetical protein GGS20DRAFT_589029 [Poronia punctata]|nr:hypothetical protein GGS20DRAFT_589029 [Poronia punctata]